MHDLNDIYYFAKIVEHGGFTAASAELGIAKSVLSEHLAKLEATLGVRLIQRTTRHFQITEVGARYYARCRDGLLELDRAANVIDDVRDVPRGKLRLACHLNFSQIILGPVLTSFMAANPEVEVVLDLTNRAVDLVSEGYDLALRVALNVRSSNVVARAFTLNQHVLVASPDFLAMRGIPARPDDLRFLPSVGGEIPPERGEKYVWHLTSADGVTEIIEHHPRLVTEDLWVIKESVIAGCGIADLPPQFCLDALSDGRLVRILPNWSLALMKLYALYPSKQGLTLAARMLIEYLADHLPLWIDVALSGILPPHGELTAVQKDRANATH
jgi:DNA-binding transcriptional LysR family regulator